MHQEEWRSIFGGDYEVSSLGNLRRARPGRRTFAGRPLKPIALRVGYLAVRPVVSGKNVQRYVHELVAAAFIGPRPSGYCVNHVDGNKQNNASTNLEYVTHAENMAHAARAGLMAYGERHHNAKLSNQDVANIRVRHLTGESGSQLARAFGVAPSTICQIVNEQRRTA